MHVWVLREVKHFEKQQMSGENVGRVGIRQAIYKKYYTENSYVFAKSFKAGLPCSYVFTIATASKHARLHSW